MRTGIKVQDVHSLRARNRKLLIGALRARLRVECVSETLGVYLVDSSQVPGAVYRVQLDTRDAMRCRCEWGRQIEWWEAGSMASPCKHILLTYWHRMTEERRAALIAADPALYAAVHGLPEPEPDPPPSAPANAGALPADRAQRGEAAIFAALVDGLYSPQAA